MATQQEGRSIMNGYSKGLVTGGLIVAGGLIGATLAILYAPKSGKETREELVKKAKDQFDEVSQKAKIWRKPQGESVQ